MLIINLKYDCKIPKPVKEENLGGANFGEETTEEGAAVKLNIEQVRRGIKNTHVRRTGVIWN